LRAAIMVARGHRNANLVYSCPLRVTCEQRHAKNFLTLPQHWSGRF
jgi:hypothetical protein